MQAMAMAIKRGHDTGDLDERTRAAAGPSSILLHSGGGEANIASSAGSPDRTQLFTEMVNSCKVTHPKFSGLGDRGLTHSAVCFDSDSDSDTALHLALSWCSAAHLWPLTPSLCRLGMSCS